MARGVITSTRLRSGGVGDGLGARRCVGTVDEVNVVNVVLLLV